MHSLFGAFNAAVVCMDKETYIRQFPVQFLEKNEHDDAQLYIGYRLNVSDDGGETAFWTYCKLSGNLQQKLWITLGLFLTPQSFQ